MTNESISGFGGARTQLDVPISRLHLDPENPRLPESAQGEDESKILPFLYREFDIAELAFSFAENGYMDEEPLVAVPTELPKEFRSKSPRQLKGNDAYKNFLLNPTTQLTVVEGNRRLAAIKVLVDPTLRKQLKVKNWPILSKEIREDLELPPVIIYPTRKEVLPYLGVRHIIGIKKWEAYAKARYIAGMVEGNLSLRDLERQVGDRSGSTRKIYICYNLIKQAEGLGLNVAEAKENFSYLQLAIGQLPIKEFLGLTGDLEKYARKNPVPKTHIKNFKRLFAWLFGEEGKRVIAESRDITNKLSRVIGSAPALEQLTKLNDLSIAFEFTDGEESMLQRYLLDANKNLERCVSLIGKHKTAEIAEQIKRLRETLEKLYEVLNEDK